MESVVEYLGSMGKGRISRKNAVLGVMFYSVECRGQRKLKVEEIRDLLVLGRIPKAKSMNISDTLSKAVPLVAAEEAETGRLVWWLTDPGVEYVRNLAEPDSDRNEIRHEAGSLESLLKKITDADVREYVDEAVKCLKVGALRACVVFLWVGSTRTLQLSALMKGTSALNQAIQKHDAKCRAVKNIDDFSYVKDAVLLKACADLGIINKSEKMMLEDALDLRNSCGHPNKYSPGVKKVAAFIEDVTTIVFT